MRATLAHSRFDSDRASNAFPSASDLNALKSLLSTVLGIEGEGASRVFVAARDTRLRMLTSLLSG